MDYDLIVIGAGYGGFDAAKHAAEKGLKTAIIESREMGGTCVNRGCVPSKALLAASGRVRELSDGEHLSSFGITPGTVQFDRQAIADHANQLVENIRANLTKSLERAGVTIVRGTAQLAGPQQVAVRQSNGVERVLSATDVLIATGSDPFVPRGIETDGLTVFTSDDAVRLESLPQWLAIIGSGYIGLEFADVYTALGCEVTMIEALDRVMPTFDPDIAKLAGRKLIESRDIDTRSGVFASKVIPGSPVKIELIDAGTKEMVEVLEVDAVLQHRINFQHFHHLLGAGINQLDLDWAAWDHLGGKHTRAGVDITAFNQLAARQLGDIGIKGGHHPIEGLDHRDFTAQSGVHIGEFQADVATTDDRQPLGQALEAHGVIAGEHRQTVGFNAARHKGIGARGNQHIGGAQHPLHTIALTDSHLLRAGQLGRATHDGDASSLEGFGEVGADVLHQLVGVISDRLAVELNGAGCDAKGGEVLAIAEFTHPAAGSQ